MAAPHLTLVPPVVPEDLAQAATDIHDGVKAGDIVGLGVVVQLRGGNFFVDVFGRMVEQPWDARGWLRSLDDKLRELGEALRED